MLVEPRAVQVVVSGRDDGTVKGSAESAESVWA